MPVPKKVERGEPSGGSEVIDQLALELFDAQSKVPRAVKAEQWLLSVVLEGNSELSQREKLAILDLLLTPSSSASFEKSSPVRFAKKLVSSPVYFNRHDVDRFLSEGFTEACVLEVVLLSAVGRFLRTLAAAWLPILTPATSPDAERPSLEFIETQGPYISAGIPCNDASLLLLRDQFGFVPNLFQSQGLRPEVVDAEVLALDAILFPEDLLSRVQKEQIMLAVSALNQSTYGVALHTQVLSALGVSEDESDRFVKDYRHASLSPADTALSEYLLAINGTERGDRKSPSTKALYEHGFSEAQVVEAIATCALGNFLNTVQFGIGAALDFPARHVFKPKDLYLSEAESRPTLEVEDPDAALVEQSKTGDTTAFEELVRRHTKRIFGTLAGMLGNLDEAQDAVQDVFLKAFEHIDGFQRRSKFSTWLVSIAINTGTEVLRQRKNFESLDTEEDEQEFRPRQLQSWADNPEKLVSAEQARNMVRDGVMRLPEKYRVAVLLRDINQLSTEDAAAALGLTVPALKARVLRGRLMLRESLTPHFARTQQRSSNA